MAEIKIADLVAEARLRDEKFTKELNDLRRTVDRKTDKMVDEFKKVERKGLISFKRLARGAASALSGIIIFFAARGIFRGFKTLVKLASDTTESMNKVKEVFGKSADSVIKFSRTAATALGSTRERALAMTGEIGNLLVAMGSTEKAAASMSIEVLSLAADLGSFNNVPTEQALNAIRSALIGETEPMRRFGSNVSAARVQTLALSKGISKATLATDEMMKAQLRLEIIFKDTKKAQGDFARTSNDFANLMKTLGALFSDAGARLGTALIPQITEFAKEIKDFVTSQKFDKLIGNLTIGFEKLAGVIGKAVKQLLRWIEATDPINKTIKQIQELEREAAVLQATVDRLFKPQDEGFHIEFNLSELNVAKSRLAGIREEIERLRKSIPAGPFRADFPSEDKTEEQSKEKTTADIIQGVTVTKQRRDPALSKTPLSELEKTLKRLQDDADETEETLADGLDEAAEAAADLDNELKSVAAQLGAATGSAEQFLRALVRIALQKLALQFTGPVGIGLSFLSGAFAGGGSGKMSNTGHVQAATGLSGRVPGGFDNDNFLLGVSSNERFKVETPTQANANDRAMVNVSKSLQALNMNISKIGTRQDIIEATVSIEDRELQLLVEKSQRRDLRFR